MSLFDKRTHGLTTIPRSTWSERAACLGEPGEFWDQIGDQVSEANRYAIAICARCPVAVQCLDDAIGWGDDSSIRAGLTGEEIRAEGRRRAGRRQAVGAR